MTLPFAQLSFPEIYEQALVGPLFRPFAQLTLQEVGNIEGCRVLDIACGTGVVSRLAQQATGSDGTVVGVDLSPAMISVAKRVGPGIAFREGDAAALPLEPHEQFDVIVCHQGFQFFPDKPAALAHMRRALIPGGRIAIATWSPEDQVPFIRELRLVAERHVGPITDRRHGFGEAGPIETLLRDGGFRNVRSKTVSHIVRFSDGRLFVRLNAMALIGMSGKAREMKEEDRSQTAAAITADSADVVSAYRDAGGLAFELTSNVTIGKG